MQSHPPEQLSIYKYKKQSINFCLNRIKAIDCQLYYSTYMMHYSKLYANGPHHSSRIQHQATNSATY